MVKKPLRVQVYVEGGGSDRGGDLAGECRRGFSELFKKATGRDVRVIACGARNSAYDAFATAVRQRKDQELPFLLVDSEEVVTAMDAWTHLQRDGKWVPLDAPAHLMVTCMEAWLLADHDALRDYFGKAFDAERIRKWPKLSEVHRHTLLDKLREATRERKGGPYGKGRDSFKILFRVDPKKLEGCAHAKAFFDELNKRLSTGRA